GGGKEAVVLRHKLAAARVRLEEKVVVKDALQAIEKSLAALQQWGAQGGLGGHREWHRFETLDHGWMDIHTGMDQN
ncbi:unnamed protein product, partial [Discosporangium mesarthrocarpum]